MKVCEIFASIQGESTYAGLPCVFIRMTGCNLRCSYCDTAYAYEEGTEMSADEIISAAAKFDIKLVELTGGEPLWQDGVIPLAKQFLDSGFSVLIETNGSISIEGVDKRATIIMDMKTPGSGMDDKMLFGNFDLLKSNDEVKFVITDLRDYEWAKEILKKYHLASKCKVLFSPAFGMLSPADLVAWILKDRLQVRLNLQLHKYIYDPNQRGV